MSLVAVSLCLQAPKHTLQLLCPQLLSFCSGYFPAGTGIGYQTELCDMLINEVPQVDIFDAQVCNN